MGRVGVGDMKRRVYDPDADGLIAVAQIEMVAAMLAQGQGLGAGSIEIAVPASGVALEATVALFQANPATGDFQANPENINDNNTATIANCGPVINRYAEVDFGIVVCIRRWRHFGSVVCTGDGRWKITYYNLATHAWVDWVTGIPVRTLASWSNFTTETEVLTNKIRLICTTGDSNYTALEELEVIY